MLRAKLRWFHCCGCLGALLLLAFLLPPVQEGIAIELSHRDAARGISDRRQLADILAPALNRYYADHGEYPPYLLGDTRTPLSSEGSFVGASGQDHPWRAADQPPDPLVAGRYIRRYPLLGQRPHACAFDHNLFTRLHFRWCSAFSTRDRQRAPGYRLPDGAELGWPGGYRLYSLGGFIPRSSPAPDALPDPAQQKYIFGILTDLSRVSSCPPFDSLSYFGYQRGEWFDADPHSAWLWFYGSSANDKYSQSQKKLRGLDLVSAPTGELAPDGVPDGICLLYKLKDGQVTQIVQATDLQP